MTFDWLASSLEKSRELGFLGPGEIVPHIEHARGFRAAWDAYRDESPGTILDLGAGGGVPGLVLAVEWVTDITLLDSMEKRCRFLREVLAVDGAPLGPRVAEGRAEALARDENLEARFDLVVARSFGPPAVTAECAARFLRLGGLLVVSEPPDVRQADRWSQAGLGKAGLRRLTQDDSVGGFAVIEKIRATPPEFPRATGVPGKKHLFG